MAMAANPNLYNNCFPTDAQWNKLMDSISTDSEMLTGEFIGDGGVERVARKWARLADQLNAMGNARKSGDKWKDAWDGLVTRAKRAMLKKSAYTNGTGGGVPADFTNLELSQIHKRVLSMIPRTKLYGRRSIVDPLEAQLNREKAARSTEEGPPGPPLPGSAPVPQTGIPMHLSAGTVFKVHQQPQHQPLNSRGFLNQEHQPNYMQLGSAAVCNQGTQQQQFQKEATAVFGLGLLPQHTQLGAGGVSSQDQQASQVAKLGSATVSQPQQQIATPLTGQIQQQAHGLMGGAVPMQQLVQQQLLQFFQNLAVGSVVQGNDGNLLQHNSMSDRPQSQETGQNVETPTSKVVSKKGSLKCGRTPPFDPSPVGSRKRLSYSPQRSGRTSSDSIEGAVQSLTLGQECNCGCVRAVSAMETLCETVSSLSDRLDTFNDDVRLLVVSNTSGQEQLNNSMNKLIQALNAFDVSSLKESVLMFKETVNVLSKLN